MSRTVDGLRSTLSPGLEAASATLRRAVATLGQHARQPGLVTRFSIIGATMALLIATTLSGLIEARLSEYIMDMTVARAVDQVELGIVDSVTPADFAGPFTPERQAELAARLDPHLAVLHRNRAGVLRLHLFAPDGTIIYSDLPSKRGQVVTISSDLAETLQGQVKSAISTLASADNSDLKARYDSAIEVHVPFVEDGQVVGAYEIYTDLAPVKPIRQLVWIAIGGGFIILFLSLFAVVRNASAFIRRQQIERELLIRQNEERFRSLVGNTSDVIAILDTDAVIRYASPPAERAWGRNAEALKGRCLFEHIHEEDLAAARDLLAQVSEHPSRNISSELRGHHAEGEWRDFEVIAKNMMDDPGVGGIVVTFHDITERKKFERELQQLAFHDTLSGLPNRALFLDRRGGERVLPSDERRWQQRDVRVMVPARRSRPGHIAPSPGQPGSATVAQAGRATSSRA